MARNGARRRQASGARGAAPRRGSGGWPKVLMRRAQEQMVMTGHRFSAEERAARKQAWYEAQEQARRQRKDAREQERGSRSRRRGHRRWTSEARAAARQRALNHPEWREVSRVNFEAKNPEFVAAYRKAFDLPQPCDTCGSQQDARPIVNRDSFVLETWRCYACRRLVRASAT